MSGFTSQSPLCLGAAVISFQRFRAGTGSNSCSSAPLAHVRVRRVQVISTLKHHGYYGAFAFVLTQQDVILKQTLMDATCTVLLPCPQSRDMSQSATHPGLRSGIIPRSERAMVRGKNTGLDLSGCIRIC